MEKKLTKQYLQKDPWKIIEKGFYPDFNKNTESICSIGNGKFGQRAMIEEKYSGRTLQGNYVAGVYYPDKTLVGWWKNGYPEYYSKVPNAVDWSSIQVKINDIEFDLAKAEILEWYREIDMKTGTLYRICKVRFNDIEFHIEAERFCSLADDRIAVQRYKLFDFDQEVNVEFIQGLDFDIQNEDSNYDEKFWDEKKIYFDGEIAYNSAFTKKTGFSVASAMKYDISVDGKLVPNNPEIIQQQKYIGFKSVFDVKARSCIQLFKTVSILSSLDYSHVIIEEEAKQVIESYRGRDFDDLKKKHTIAWAKKWALADIEIDGDISAQQAIRFNIFHLNQTYTGEDSRLNIGPKGFTGERYGGSTYWDTEAYCLPFYLSTSEEKVARQLLLYRYNQLDKAYENAVKIGFTNGEALYPMVTMNGEECHNEWEITFEELHRNGAIAYAIFDYVRYTDDQDYLVDYGLEVLIGIARFWASRVHYSEHSKSYMMHGITGPNEYDNNVNNNWYTNYIARWCLIYAQDATKVVNGLSSKQKENLFQKLNFSPEIEFAKWNDIIENMYLKEDDQLGIFIQQDNYLDKEQILVKDLDKKHLPLNHNWSWDRILRSCFIKQADVLQGMYFFEDDFSIEQHRKNYIFYDARTVHESSLSPCVHSILASKLDMHEAAYNMYLRTARLDLDDYNNDTEDGLHITSMAGTWMSIVKGFAGMRVKNNQLHFTPAKPKAWKSFHFNFNFRNRLLHITINDAGMQFELKKGDDISIFVNNKEFALTRKKEVLV